MDAVETPEDAAAVVERGDRVVVDTSRPRSVLHTLADRTDLEDVTVYAYGYPYADSSGLATLARTDGVTLAVSMVPPALRSLVADGTVEFVPRSLLAASRAPFGSGAGRRVGLLATPPVTAAPETPLGALSTFGSRLVADADVTVVSTSDRVPAPPNGVTVPTAAIDHAVETADSPPVLGATAVDDVERRIAANVADVLPPDPTVQLGIGSVATAVARHLVDAGPLRLWTGLVGTGARDLLEAGDVTSATACVALGSDEAFYDWVTGTDAVEFVPATVTHDPGRLGRLDRFVAVNSAIQVDLTGQVNAETVEGRQFSGAGGQLDFATVASARPDGRAVVALPARTRSGVSKVVPAIADADVVTTPRQAVDVVVTEWGVARLDGSLRERARALVAVAHPDDRERLARAARERGLH
jgi:acyl-CoA hydrolase